MDANGDRVIREFGTANDANLRGGFAVCHRHRSGVNRACYDSTHAVTGHQQNRHKYSGKERALQFGIFTKHGVSSYKMTACGAEVKWEVFKTDE